MASSSLTSSRPTAFSSSSAFARCAASSFRLPRKVAEKTLDVRRTCMAVSTFSKTVMDLNRRIFWNVRAMPRFVMTSGV